MIILIPISTVLLVGSMVYVGTESVIAIISYVISAYTLTVWCFKIPHIISFFKMLRNENKYVIKLREDARLRVNVTLYGSLTWNGLYGIFQLWLGFYHQTFWFFAFGVYYICLGLMRFSLAGHTTRYAPGDRIEAELKKYRACGVVFLVMNSALAIIIFFMVYFNRTFEHHMITAIAMAAYTFTALTMAIISVIRYRKYNSPVYSASKAISLAAALVSMLTLESTMLTTFSDGSMTPLAQKWMLAVTGGVISVLIVATAIYMIVIGTKKLKQLTPEIENGK
jgi:hypothetical protein